LDRPRAAKPTDGVLLVDKPAGCTSHDVVSRVRRAFGQKRVGHAGTLDPPATGLLVMLLGQATRLQAYAMGSDKTYEFDLVLGVATHTLDLTGEVLAEAPVPADALAGLPETLARFVGEVRLVPPMVSALHHEGRRLYEIARKGEEVEREARLSRIDELVALREPWADGERWRVRLRVACSSGTYVRSLGEALAGDLGLPGAIDALRRTRIGRFLVEDACTLEAVQEGQAAGRVLGPEVLLHHLPLADLSESDAARFLHGNVVTWGGDAEGEVRVCAGARFLGIGLVTDGGRLQPSRVLSAREDAGNG
jgi:tRNA pseudouridine55 synthase